MSGLIAKKTRCLAGISLRGISLDLRGGRTRRHWRPGTSKLLRGHATNFVQCSRKSNWFHKDTSARRSLRQISVSMSFVFTIRRLRSRLLEIDSQTELVIRLFCSIWQRIIGGVPEQIAVPEQIPSLVPSNRLKALDDSYWPASSRRAVSISSLPISISDLCTRHVFREPLDLCKVTRVSTGGQSGS